SLPPCGLPRPSSWSLSSADLCLRRVPASQRHSAGRCPIAAAAGTVPGPRWAPGPDGDVAPLTPRPERPAQGHRPVNIYEFLPIRLLVEAAYEVVTTLTSFLHPLAGAHSAALAVIVLTLLVRAVLIPVGVSQVKAGITRRRLAPKISELRSKHKDKPELMQQRLMELYKEENASPLAGCLPVLAQMPVLMAVYGLFINSSIGGRTNELPGHTVLRLPLNPSFVKLLGAGAPTGTAITGYPVPRALIARVPGAPPPPPPPAPPEAPAAAGSARSAPDSPTMPDLSGLMKTLSFMPFLTAIFALFVPLAAAVYLATTTSWTLGERLVLNRLLGANDPLPEERARVSG